MKSAIAIHQNPARNVSIGWTRFAKMKRISKEQQKIMPDGLKKHLELQNDSKYPIDHPYRTGIITKDWDILVSDIVSVYNEHKTEDF